MHAPQYKKYIVCGQFSFSVIVKKIINKLRDGGEK